jgi:hypothetical protein
VSSAFCVGNRVTFLDDDVEVEGEVMEVVQASARVRVLGDDSYTDVWAPLRSLTLITEH